jgi:MFS family permease
MAADFTTDAIKSTPTKDYLIREPEFQIKGVSRAYRWYVFAILCLLYLFDYADRLVLSSVMELIKEEWSLTDTQLSELSTVIWLTVGFLALPVSFLIDRWSRRKSIAIMAMVWSLATLACRFVTGFGQLLFLRGVLGVGEAGYSAGAYPLLSAYFSREHRAKVFGFFSAFTAIGAATGVLVGGHIGYTYGWRWAFGLVAIPGVFLAVLAWFIRDYKTVPLDAGASGLTRLVGRTVFDILKIPSFIYASLGTMCHDIAFAGLMMWLVSFLIRFRGLEGKQASTLSGVIMMMALIGSPLGGLLADYLYKKTPRGRNYTAALSNALMACMIILFCLIAENAGTGVFMAVGIIMGISVTLYIAADASINQDIVHQGYRSVVWGMRMFITMALGGAVGILLTGVLSDYFESLKISLMVIALFGFLGAIFYLIGARHYEADLARVKVMKLEAEK